MFRLREKYFEISCLNLV